VTPTFTIEFILWLLIAASLIAVISDRLKIPYTVALVLGGLALGSVHFPAVQDFLKNRPEWLSPNVGLVIFLPALLFEGSLKFQIRHLRENVVPIFLLANIGVLVSTLVTGFAVHWFLSVPLLVALVFGAIVAATDPISVLAIFRSMAVNKRLATIVEGESLFNDGTAVVLYTILLAALVTGHLSFWAGARGFFVEVLGGVAVGLMLGYVFSKITQRIDEPQIEITLTTILAYGSYLIAEWLHVSGVIATVTAGLMIGNFGARIGMSPRTRIALWSFWEYVSFVINSLVFLLIGFQVRIGEWLQSWHAILLTIGAVVAARMLSVYGLLPVSNLFTAKIPNRWGHVMVWGGMRGALSLALALSLFENFPYRSQNLAMTFGVVAFTIVIQGLTIKPLIRALGIGTSKEDDYSRARVRQMAVSSAMTDLDQMLDGHIVSTPVYRELRNELNTRQEKANSEIQEIYSKGIKDIKDEIQLARRRLIAAEKSSIEEAMHAGLVSEQTAAHMLDEADKRLDKLSELGESEEPPVDHKENA
jgi:Na+:H+ antiporter